MLTGIAIGATPGAGLATAAVAAVILAVVMAIILWALALLPDAAMPLSIEAID